MSVQLLYTFTIASPQWPTQDVNDLGGNDLLRMLTAWVAVAYAGC